MNFFDRVIATFSAADLSSRVKGVIAIGTILCLVIGIGGYFFLSKNFTISVEGMGRWSGNEGRLLEVSIAHDDIGRLPDIGSFVIELAVPEFGPFKTEAKLQTLDPSKGILYLLTQGVPSEYTGAGRLDVGIIIAQMPYWQLLLGRER